MTAATRTFDERINSAAAGNDEPGVELYWDEQDPNDMGPAYRVGGESGALDFVTWSAPEGHDLRGYHVDEYFGTDGAYRGPDMHGVYPIFETR